MTADKHQAANKAELFQVRNHAYAALRGFFSGLGFVEVETPCLVPCPGTEAYLEYFATTWTDLQRKPHPQWLRSSPELHMKRLLCEGMQKIFQFSRCFRNGGELGDWHHPEFTLLEWYARDLTLGGMIEQTLQLCQVLSQTLAQAGYAPALAADYFGKPKRFTMAQAFQDLAGLHLDDQGAGFVRQCQSAGYAFVNSQDDFDSAFGKVLLTVLEPKFKELGCVIIQGYPPSMAALSRIEAGLAQRFELYIEGIEVCNAFYELQEVEKNLDRVQTSNHIRRTLGMESIDLDQGFLAALRQGLPECCGNALGFDRVLALILGRQSLRDLVPFREDFFHPGR